MKNIRARLCPAYNANNRLPEGLSNLLIQEVSSLPLVCPKGKYLKEVWLSKYVSSETAEPIVRRNAAIRKWLAVERDNEATADRLMNTHPDFHVLPGVKMVDFVEFARRLIAQILGDVPSEKALIGAFSGGASTSKPRTSSHPSQKYIGKAHITKEALIWVDILRECLPGWSSYWDQLEISVVPGNVMFTVPKKTDIDRCACKEPDINMFLQKGFGRIIRDSLRRVGIDLNDQSINQRLAQQGSFTGDLATIDLSSASDSVSSYLVELLLPDLWYSALNSVRCRVTDIDGEEHVNEMFSSMGNGFTFELESLIFYALSRTSAYFTGTPGVISVYGDDIIVPSTLYPSLTFVLEWFGFSVNMDKSFYTGPFRESCGGHFINGHDVSPIYLKGPIDRISDLILFLNQLRGWSIVGEVIGCDPDLYDLWSFGASFVPSRFWGGSDYTSRYQLVAPFQGGSKLFPVSKSSDTGLGGYIHWLNVTAFRTTASDGISTSRKSTELDRMTVRRVPRTVFTEPLFYQEWRTSVNIS